MSDLLVGDQIAEDLTLHISQIKFSFD